jgi:tetratricopeptide (TPR) repeat protein
MRLGLLAVGLVLSACAPRLYVNVLRPAPVSLGGAKRLLVTAANGRLDARERVLHELMSQTNGAGYFTVIDRAAAQPAAGEVALNVSVLEYGATPDPTSEKHTGFVGKVVLGVTATDATGRALVAGKQYRGNITGGGGEEDALAASTHQAVAALLDDITPSFVRQAIDLDEDDDAQRPIVKLARQGDLKRAVSEERELLQRAPTAAAAFNLGALLDAQGEYAEALTFYDQALKLGPKELYAEMRGACARRLADTQALAP